ncbi:MAG TPA: hypothetical protein VHM31_25310 [Polyangia bacterium]|nr:hypothetical protein [Polyangia bacterium]
MRLLVNRAWAVTLLVGLAAGCGSGLQPTGAGGSGGTATGGAPATGGSGAGGSPGTGGAGGSADGGSLAAVCRSFAQAYAAALPAAERCSVGAADPCTTLVPEAVAGDGCITDCQVYVSDATALNAIIHSMQEAGCFTLPSCVLTIACATPAAGLCMPGDGGDGVCQNVQNVAR